MTATRAMVRRVERVIIVVRNVRVILDVDLAELYGVTTRELVQAVKRKKSRFPADFMFRLTAGEVADLRSQSVISRSAHGGRRTPPYAFTEQGVAMLSSVLNSPAAVRANIQIMRTFVRLRMLLQPASTLTKRLDALEAKYDGQFSIVFEAIRELMMPAAAPRKRIGFRT